MSSERSDLVPELVARMAHQLRNPMQAISVNLEVVRAKVRADAPELWEELERFASAADENVRLLDRRLGLLLAAGRRGPEETPRTVAPGRLLADLSAALRWDREAPAVRVEFGDGAEDAGVRAPEGALVALAFRAIEAARSAAGGEEIPVRVVSEADGTVIEVPLPAPENAGKADAEPWARLATEAGGRAVFEGEGADRYLRLLFEGP